MLRFYGRQMITSQTNKSIITQIENILNKYFTETKLKEQGLPTVKFLLTMHLSPVIWATFKKKRVKNQEHIHFTLLKKQKNW
jgi:hypothetical protein